MMMMTSLIVLFNPNFLSFVPISINWTKKSLYREAPSYKILKTDEGDKNLESPGLSGLHIN